MNTESANPLEALVQCLQDEYRALLAEDLPQLERVLATKQQLLAELAAATGTMAMGARQGNGQRPRAPRALARLRALNERNALVLAPRSAGNRARLQFLQSALGRAPLYAADGSVRGGA